jgi:hypothetical protein
MAEAFRLVDPGRSRQSFECPDEPPAILRHAFGGGALLQWVGDRRGVLGIAWRFGDHGGGCL